MKKNIKILCKILMLISIIIMIGSNFVEATGFNYASALKDPWTNTGDNNVLAPTKNVVGSIVQIIRVVGTGISIIMLTYVAIKYMSAAPNEKAEFKKSATAFVVGAIVLFATTNILGIIEKFAKSNISVK